MEERESFIKMLRVHTQTYNPGDFAKNGVKLLVKLRDLNLKVVKTSSKFASSFQGTPPLAGFPNALCPLCRVFKRDAEYLPNVSSLMQKVSYLT